MRSALFVVALTHLSACDNSGDLPDHAYAIEPNQSYTFPEAVVGIPIQSPREAQEIDAALMSFAHQYGLRRYRRIDDAPAKAQADPAYWDLRVSTSYISPWERSGFDVVLMEFSEECHVVGLYERSGIWRPQTLGAWRALEGKLSKLTDGRSLTFTEPRTDQNWPTQSHHPNRPVYLAQLCVRMGFADPRPIELVRLQGPLK
jgi:hypothetical protein